MYCSGMGGPAHKSLFMLSSGVGGCWGAMAGTRPQSSRGVSEGLAYRRCSVGTRERLQADRSGEEGTGRSLWS